MSKLELGLGSARLRPRTHDDFRLAAAGLQDRIQPILLSSILAFAAETARAPAMPCIEEAGAIFAKVSNASVALRPHTVVPTSAPMLAVRAMAAAPQKVTRTVAFRMFAPPALAPIAPSNARKISDAMETA